MTRLSLISHSILVMKKIPVLSNWNYWRGRWENLWRRGVGRSHQANYPKRWTGRNGFDKQLSSFHLDRKEDKAFVSVNCSASWRPRETIGNLHFLLRTRGRLDSTFLMIHETFRQHLLELLNPRLVGAFPVQDKGDIVSWLGWKEERVWNPFKGKSPKILFEWAGETKQRLSPSIRGQEAR